MKVLCIDASNQKEEPYVVEMEHYTVANERIREDGIVQYELNELADEEYENWFNAERFIPLSEQDELVLQETDILTA